VNAVKMLFSSLISSRILKLLIGWNAGEVNIEVLAAGNETLHKAALSGLAWS
jgi:hypothetical protein